MFCVPAHTGRGSLPYRRGLRCGGVQLTGVDLRYEPVGELAQQAVEGNVHFPLWPLDEAAAYGVLPVAPQFLLIGRPRVGDRSRSENMLPACWYGSRHLLGGQGILAVAAVRCCRQPRPAVPRDVAPSRGARSAGRPRRRSPVMSSVEDCRLPRTSHPVRATPAIEGGRRDGSSVQFLRHRRRTRPRPVTAHGSTRPCRTPPGWRCWRTGISCDALSSISPVSGGSGVPRRRHGHPDLAEPARDRPRRRPGLADRLRRQRGGRDSCRRNSGVRKAIRHPGSYMSTALLVL